MARFDEMTAPGREGETLDEVFQRMLGSSGRCEGYIEVCRDLDIPSGKFLLWLQADTERYKRFNEVLETQHRLMGLEVVGIADAEPRMRDDGVIDAGDIAWKRVKMDARKWVVPFHAKEYVERKQVDVTVTHDLASRLIAARGRVVREEVLALVGESRVGESRVGESRVVDAAADGIIDERVL